MKTDFRDVEVGGIYFSGELSVIDEDNIEISEVSVKRPGLTGPKSEEINVKFWKYKDQYLASCLEEALEDKIIEMLEELDQAEEKEIPDE